MKKITIKRNHPEDREPIAYVNFRTLPNAFIVIMEHCKKNPKYKTKADYDIDMSPNESQYCRQFLN